MSFVQQVSTILSKFFKRHAPPSRRQPSRRTVLTVEHLEHRLTPTAARTNISPPAPQTPQAVIEKLIQGLDAATQAGKTSAEIAEQGIAQVSKETGVPLVMDAAGADNVTKWDRTPTVVRTAISSSQINLAWNAVTPPSGCSATYNVYRGATATFTQSSANQIASGLSTP